MLLSPYGPPPPYISPAMSPPAARDERLDRLGEAVARLTALVEDARDTGRETRRDVADLREDSAAMSTRLKAVEMAQASTAASLVNGYREHTSANSELMARVDAVQKAASAFVPEETNRQAEPVRRRMITATTIGAGAGGAVLVISVFKFFVPDVHHFIGILSIVGQAFSGSAKVLEPLN